MNIDPVQDAILLAERLLRNSLRDTTRSEAAQMKRLSRMISNPEAKQLSLAMTDRLGRSQSPVRSAQMWRDLLNRFGTVHGFSLLDHTLLEMGKHWSRLFPGLVMKAVNERLLAETREVILPAENEALTEYLRANQDTRINLNQLGEAVLGEVEATRRLRATIDLLKRDDVDYVSVKISAIFSQINLVAWDESLEMIKSRLRKLYRAAMPGNKFVNLDMEAYRDLELTIAAFKEVLSESEFIDTSAGLALQAYLPDSISAQKDLTSWARYRIQKGGAPIKIRLVKGANLAMEKVEAEIHGWSVATHPNKLQSDACFKAMLEFACIPENAAAVRIGVGSHNLFDLALALILREQNNVVDYVEIEMLQGMAPAQARTVRDEAGQLLLYTPIVNEEEYASALAYLIRRLDENTARGNFLASLFSLKPGSPEWTLQKDEFIGAWKLRDQVNDQSHRATLPPRDITDFQNQPDTDWTRAEHRKSLKITTPPSDIPPTAGRDEIEAALSSATSRENSWWDQTIAERSALLLACGNQLAESRFRSLAILRDEGKKAPMEADSEISEAIDFARYYAKTGLLSTDLEAKPLRTVLIAPPWNFPFAIPCGGILAALMAGNTVIFKPAPESVKTGWWLVRQLWDAGIPEDALHFVACADGETGRSLIEDPRVSAVVLTGAYQTARRFHQWRPSLKLFAETSGKNAITITAMADRELAVADLVKSAFGHSGQKCSAASLGILEKEVYEDKKFLQLLKDVTASLKVGPATDPASRITPLVQPPGETLLRALTTLDEGEEWLLKPEVSRHDPCLWSPGIKTGVKPGSWFHQTECFGPVLGLMRAENLEEAIHIQNTVKYGLTAGLHSLDETEIASWTNRIEAGNLYINRSTTGAIVERQPFGGWKRSSIGPGCKAGGPNYVNLFRTLTDLNELSLAEIEASFSTAWNDHFSIEHDPAALASESNRFRYVPRKGVLLRITEPDFRSETIAKIAARICGVKLIISHASDESDSALANRLPELISEIDSLRTLGEAPSDRILSAVHPLNINWIDFPVVGNGRIELTRWMKEQSISETMHRYGNIISRPAPN